MLIQRTTQLAFPQLQSSMGRPLFCSGALSPSLHKNSTIATRDWSWEMANWVICCVGIILSGLHYRFSSCRGVDKDINHDDSDLWLNCWSGVNINLARDVEMYLWVVVYHKCKADKHIATHWYIQHDIKNWRYVLYSLGIANPCDPSIRDPWSAKYRSPILSVLLSVLLSALHKQICQVYTHQKGYVAG